MGKIKRSKEDNAACRAIRNRKQNVEACLLYIRTYGVPDDIITGKDGKKYTMTNVIDLLLKIFIKKEEYETCAMLMSKTKKTAPETEHRAFLKAAQSVVDFGDYLNRAWELYTALHKRYYGPDSEWRLPKFPKN
jgi:hypothetical protein